MEAPIFSVKTVGRSTWAVARAYDRTSKTVHITSCPIEAQRMRDELERADKSAFYEGLIIGRSEICSRPRSSTG